MLSLAFAGGIVVTAAVTKLLHGIESYDLAVLMSGPILVSLGLIADRSRLRNQQPPAKTSAVTVAQAGRVRNQCTHKTGWDVAAPQDRVGWTQTVQF